MMNSSSYAEHFMQRAIELSIKAKEANEVPVACIIVDHHQIIASAFNQTVSRKSPLAHAEMIALEEASSVKGDWRLNDCDLFVTMEPCLMCWGAIQIARIRSVYYGVDNPKTGAWSGPSPISTEGLNTFCFHGILEHRIKEILGDFFEDKRRGG